MAAVVEGLKTANLGLSFLLELCLLAALAYWGFQLDRSLLVRVALAAGAPLLAALIWGVLFAPNSGLRLHPPWLQALQVLLFAVAALALYRADRAPLALALIVLVVVNQALAAVWRQ